MTETSILKQSKNPFSSFEKGEGFGFVVLAAMVNGVPAGASSLIGTRGAVLHHELGAVGNSGNPDALCASNLNALISPRKVPRGQTHFGFPSFQVKCTHCSGQWELEFPGLSHVSGLGSPT
jgi:hypothetical protein